jgi:hypothetical protein
MAQDTVLAQGAPGIASFATQTFAGADEPRYGEGVPTTTDQFVTTPSDLNLPIYSVVSVSGGVLALAQSGAAAGVATGALTFTGVGADGETIVIGGRTFTLRPVADGANEVKIGASAAATAANLATAINGGVPATEGAGAEVGPGTEEHDDVRAEVSGAVVTLFARDPGDEGNSIATTETSAAASFGAATLTGGSDDPDALPYGILAHPVVMTAGQEMSVSFYREGHWDMRVLNWHPSFESDSQKKHAFENSRSPNVFISRKKFHSSDVIV